MTVSKKVVAMLLALLMIFSSFSALASAETTASGTVTIKTEIKNYSVDEESGITFSDIDVAEPGDSVAVFAYVGTSFYTANGEFSLYYNKDFFEIETVDDNLKDVVINPDNTVVKDNQISILGAVDASTATQGIIKFALSTDGTGVYKYDATQPLIYFVATIKDTINNASADEAKKGSFYADADEIRKKDTSGVTGTINFAYAESETSSKNDMLPMQYWNANIVSDFSSEEITVLNSAKFYASPEDAKNDTNAKEVPGVSGTTDNEVPEQFTNDGYTFVGYESNFDNVIGKTATTFTMTDKVGEKYVAQWVKNGDVYVPVYYVVDGKYVASTTSNPGTYLTETKINGITYTTWFTSEADLEAGTNGKTAGLSVELGLSGLTLYSSSKYATPDTYDMTFIANGGAFGDEETEIKLTGVEYGQGFEDKEGYSEPTKDGYNFIGWAAKDSTKAIDVCDGVNLTLYAIWAPIEYTINFYKGEELIDTLESDYDDEISTPANPTEDGKTFVKWYLVDTDGAEYDLNWTSVLAVDTNKNYSVNAYAKMENAYYAVNYYLDGVCIKSDTAEGTTDYEILFSINGKNFSKWYVNADKTGAAYNYDSENPCKITVTDRIDLYAYTSDGDVDTESYTITFDANGGTFEAGTTKVAPFKAGDSFSAVVPTRAGYDFVGWFAAEEGGAPIETCPELDGAMTFYAHWEAAEYLFSFYTSTTAGTAIYTGEAYASDYGENPISTPLDPEMNGYSFDGWFYDKTLTKAFDEEDWVSVLAADEDGDRCLDLYAKWTNVGFEVTLDKNNENATITGKDKTTVLIGQKLSEAFGTVTVTSSVVSDAFSGWNTEADGSGTSYPATLDAELTDNVTENITLYAQWNKITYDVTYVTFDETEGKIETVKTGVIKDSSVYGSAPSNGSFATRTWATEDGTEVDENAKVTSAITYYAVYKPVVTYTIVDSNNVETNITHSETKTFTYNTEENKFVVDNETITNWDPAQAEYTLDGWYSKITCTGDKLAENAKITTPEDLNYYGKLEAVLYDIVLNPGDGTFVGGSTDSITLHVAKGVNFESDADYKQVVAPEHYHFVGWYDGENKAPETVEGAASYTAKYAGDEYTVTFMNGETPVETITETYNNEVKKPENNPEKENYTFDGWFLADETTELSWNAIFANADKDNKLTVYAKFTLNTFDVTLYANNTNATVNGKTSETKTVNSGTKLSDAFAGITVTSTEASDTLSGWNTQADGKGTHYAADFGDTTVTSAMELYAEWNTTTFEVTYVIYDETSGKKEVKSNINKGAKVYDLAPENEYAPVLWYDVNGNFVSKDATVEAAATYYANYSVTLTYEVLETTQEFTETKTFSYDSTAGKFVYNNEVIQVMSVSDVGEDKEFSGWYDNAELTGDKLEAGTKMGAPKNINYYGKIVDKTFKVTLKAGDGSFEGGANELNLTVVYGDSFTVAEGYKAIVAPANYHFLKWVDESGMIAPDTVTEDATYTAKFEGDEYEITFMNGEEEIDTIPQNYGEDFDLAAEPTGENLEFRGWYFDNETYETELTWANVLAADTDGDCKVTVYAKMGKVIGDPDYVYVRYIVNGKAVLQVTPAFGSDYTVVALEDYGVTEWNTKMDMNGETVKAGKVYTALKENLNLYSTSVVAGDVTVKLDPNGGKFGESEDPINLLLKEADAFTVAVNYAEPTRAGYKFLGWTTEKDGSKFAETAASEDMTVYAKWEADGYTITFMNGEEEIDSIPQEYGEDISTPADPTAEKFSFAGWFFDQDVWETELNWDNVLAADTDNDSKVTVYAKMERSVANPDYVYVRYIINGKAVLQETPAFGSDYTVKSINEVTEWYTDRDCEGTPVAVGTNYSELKGNLQFFAKTFNENSFDVKLDPNGGNFNKLTEAITVTLTEGASFVSADNYVEPEMYGYDFIGWTTEKDGFRFVDTATKEVETVYAKWAPKEFEIKFMNGTEEIDIIPQEYGEDEIISVPADPEKTDYTFKGWYLDENCTKAFSGTWDDVIENADEDNMLTLYAKFKSNSAADVVKLMPKDENSTAMIERNGIVETYNQGLTVAKDGCYGVTSIITAYDTEYEHDTEYDTTDYSKWYIYGLNILDEYGDVKNFTIADLKNAITVENGSFKVFAATDKELKTELTGDSVVIGTGTLVVVYDESGEEIERFRVIIFGDLDGVNSFRVDDVNEALYANNWLRAWGDKDNPIYNSEYSYYDRAADVNDQNGMFTRDDYNELLYADNNLRSINQITGRTEVK